MLEAEERGITSANVDEMLKSADPNIKRLLGVTPGFGQALGVDEKWVYNIIKQVGNYSTHNGRTADCNTRRRSGKVTLPLRLRWRSAPAAGAVALSSRR